MKDMYRNELEVQKSSLQTEVEKKANQNDAFTEMMNRGSAEDVVARLERPIVVIRGDSLEAEVIDAVGSQNVGEASFNVVGVGVTVGHGR